MMCTGLAPLALPDALDDFDGYDGEYQDSSSSSSSSSGSNDEDDQHDGKTSHNNSSFLGRSLETLTKSLFDNSHGMHSHSQKCKR